MSEIRSAIRTPFPTLIIWGTLITVAQAQAVWNNTGTGDWFNANNWSSASVPTSITSSSIDNGGTAQISSSGAQSLDLYVGNAATGNLLIQDGGTLTLGSLSIPTAYVGNQASSVGSVTVDGAGSTLTYEGFGGGSSGFGSGADAFIVGYSGQGSLTIQNGGSVIATNSDVYLGVNANSNGSLTLTGTGSSFSVNPYSELWVALREPPA